MKEEFEKALNELRDRKTPGVNEISAVFIKNSGENVKNMLYELVYRIYETGKITQDFTKCIIMPTPKKQEQVPANSIEHLACFLMHLKFSQV